MNTHSPFEPSYVGNHDGGGTLVADRPAPQDEQPDPVGDVPEDIRGGTVKDVLDWVNGDAGRAETALAIEETRDQPRATLTGPLQALLSPPQAE